MNWEKVMTEEKLRKLADIAAGLSGVAEHQTAQTATLLCAVGALVHTHPDPEAFSAAFRRCWMHLGQPNQEQPDDSQASIGIDAVLSVLEQLCPVPLGVRPPDQAERPGEW
jgi:hypothetical protein